MMNPKCIILNSTYEPLDVISSRRALNLFFKGKAHIVDHYDYEIHSESMTFLLPSTIALNTYVSGRKVYTAKAVLSQRNLFIRDNHTCQYCGRHASELTSAKVKAKNRNKRKKKTGASSVKEILTRDHVIPKKLGGSNTWENVVTSCSTCNNRKGDVRLEDTNLTLFKVPTEPTQFEILMKSKMKGMII